VDAASLPALGCIDEASARPHSNEPAGGIPALMHRRSIAMSELGVIIDPSAPARVSVPAVERMPADLRGKVVGFIDNSKNNFNVLVEELSDLLVREYGVARVVKQRKRAASVPATDAILREIQDNCDLVIAGSGD